MTFVSRALRRCGLGALSLFAVASFSEAQTRADTIAPSRIAKVPIGFSKLLIRIDGADDIGIARADLHVRLIEEMRAQGFHAVGAESLVFDKDETRRAEYLVGGTVREVACEKRYEKWSCRVGVEWQLFDVAADAIVYTALTRSSVIDLPDSKKDQMVSLLLVPSFDNFLRREKFHAALVARDDHPTPTDPTHEMMSIATCAPAKKVAETAEDLLRATVVVKTKEGFGSGFFLTSDGLVATAAHVVDSPTMKIRFRDGTETDAVLVRIAPHADVALLRPATPLKTAQRCAPLRGEVPAVGAEVYAAGAPTSLDLAFSLTRGIVSGLPTIDGRRRLQTDASVNPGNSGGPLADKDGNVVGVLSFKIVGGRVEGLAFAVPMRETLSALGLEVGATTDARLMTESTKRPTKPEVEAIVDTPDPMPSLDPKGDERRAASLRDAEKRAAEEEEERVVAERRAADLKRREDERDRLTPWYVPAMRWGGFVTGAVGLGVGAIAYAQFDKATTTQSSFDSLRIWNVVGWTACFVGVGAAVTSYIVAPSLPAAEVSTGRTTSLRVGVGFVQWGGSF